MYEWKLFGSKWCGWQPGPVLAAEAGAGEADGRAGGDDQHEHHRVRPGETAERRAARARRRADGRAAARWRPRAHCSPRLAYANASPAPSETDPIRARKSARARELGLERRGPGRAAARRAGRLPSAGRRRARRAPARPRRAPTGAYSRLLRVPAVETPARAASSAPGERRQPRRVERDPHAAARRHLVRVAEQPEAGDVGDRVRRERAAAASAASRFSVRIHRTASAGVGEAALRAAEHERGAERLRQVERVARAARPPSARSPSGETVPTTASPYFGSASRIVWPPASIAPAARTWRSAPSKIARTVSVGSSSGKRGDREREQRHAAHREDVVQRVRRGDRAEVVGVVDDRREEVDREDERPLVVELVDRRVVGRVEPDEQVLGLGGHEAAQQLLEPRRPSTSRRSRPPSRDR